VLLVQLVILSQPTGHDFLQVKSHRAMFCDLRPKRKLVDRAVLGSAEPALSASRMGC